MTIQFHSKSENLDFPRGGAYRIIIHHILNDRRAKAGINMTPKNSSRNIKAASNFALSNTVDELGKIVR